MDLNYNQNSAELKISNQEDSTEQSNEKLGKFNFDRDADGNNLAQQKVEQSQNPNGLINKRQSGIDETFISHRRRKMIDPKSNQEQIISNRSLTRAKQRASSKQSSRSSKSLSDAQDAQRIQTLNRITSTDKSLGSEIDIAQNYNRNDEKHVILEQDQEETMGDEAALTNRLSQANRTSKANSETNKQEAQQKALDSNFQENDQQAEKLPEPKKQVITFDMIQSLQQSKQAQALVNKNKASIQDQNKFQEDEKPLTSSWEKSIKETSSSFIGDLFSKLSPLGGFSFGTQQISKPSVEPQLGYNRKVTLIIKNQEPEPSYKELQTMKQSIDPNIPAESSLIKIQESLESLLEEDANQQQVELNEQKDIYKEVFALFNDEEEKQDLYSFNQQESINTSQLGQNLSFRQISTTPIVKISKSDQDDVIDGEQIDKVDESFNKADKKFNLTTMPLIDIQSKSNVISYSSSNIVKQQSALNPIRDSRKSFAQKGDENAYLSDTQNSGKNYHKNLNNHLLEMSFNNPSSKIQKDPSNYIEISFQGSNTHILNNKGSDLMESLTPTSKNENIDFDSDEQIVSLKEDTLDLLFYYIIKDELKGACQKLEKETEEQVIKVSLYRAEDQIISEVIDDLLDHMKQDMYHKFIDNKIEQAQDKVVERIIDEYILLFDLGSPENTADYLANQLEDKMLKGIVDFLDNEESQQSERLKLASDAIQLKQLMTQMDQFKDEINRDYESFLANKEQQFKSKRKQKNNRSSSKMRIQNIPSHFEGILDIEFFEKCFFGKKLQIKDQIIFKIYAEELLEIIKDNFSKEVRKKYKQLLNTLSLRSKSKQKARTKKRFRSPQPNEPIENNQNETEKPPKIYIRKSLTPTNEINRSKSNLLLAQEYYKTLHNLRNQNKSDLYSSDRQPINSEPISINIVEQQNEDPSPGGNNILNNNSYYYQTMPVPQLAEGGVQAPSTLNKNINLPSSNLSHNPHFTNTNDQQSQNDMTQASSISRKKRQPSQIKRPIADVSKLQAAQKSPPRQQQVRIFHNLETQMKEILKNDKPNIRIIQAVSNFSTINGGNIKQIKLKKRNAQTTANSLQVSPQRPSMNNISSARNAMQQAQTVQAPQELPAVKKINKYKFQNFKSNSYFEGDQDEQIEQEMKFKPQIQNFKYSYSQGQRPPDGFGNSHYQQMISLPREVQVLNIKSSLGSIAYNQGQDDPHLASFQEYQSKQDLGIYGQNQFSAQRQQQNQTKSNNNMQFAPNQMRSLSVMNKTLDAGQLIKKNKSRKKMRSPSVNPNQINLNATSIVGRLKKPQSKGRYGTSNLQDKQKTTLNNYMMNQNYGQFKRFQLNQEKINKKSTINSDGINMRDEEIVNSNYQIWQNPQQRQSDLNSNQYAIEIDGQQYNNSQNDQKQQKKYSHINVEKRVSQSQMRNYGQNIVNSQFKTSNQVLPNLNSINYVSYIDRQNMSGQNNSQFYNSSQQQSQQQQQYMQIRPPPLEYEVDPNSMNQTFSSNVQTVTQIPIRRVSQEIEEVKVIKNIRDNNQSNLAAYKYSNSLNMNPYNIINSDTSNIPQLKVQNNIRRKTDPQFQQFNSQSLNHSPDRMKNSQHRKVNHPNSFFPSQQSEELPINSDRIQRELSSIKQNSNQIESMLDQYMNNSDYQDQPQFGRSGTRLYEAVRQVQNQQQNS